VLRERRRRRGSNESSRDNTTLPYPLSFEDAILGVSISREYNSCVSWIWFLSQTKLEIIPNFRFHAASVLSSVITYQLAFESEP
jgi:hypothetical protein